MKSSLFIIIAVVGGLLLTPILVYGESGQTTAGKAPISQPLVREGTLAGKLVEALKLGTASNEAEAESMLAGVGVAPRNGWIADYPVTPDIVGELQSAVSDAADAQRLTMGKDEALRALQDVLVVYGLSVSPPAVAQGEGSALSYSPDPTVINNYYYDYGPPVVTYYAPPPYYSYLYTWVPYPFWWWDFWFPGFFVLTDFHRIVFVDGHVRFCSNHFFDPVSHHVARIDPVSRFHGRTLTGIGATGANHFASAGMSKGTGGGFSGNGSRAVSNMGRTVPSSSGSRTFTTHRNNVTGNRTPVMSSGGRRAFNSPSVGSRSSAPYYSAGRSFTAPSFGRSFSGSFSTGRSFGSTGSFGGWRRR